MTHALIMLELNGIHDYAILNVNALKQLPLSYQDRGWWYANTSDLIPNYAQRTMNGKEMRFALHENGTLMVSGKGADNVVRPSSTFNNGTFTVYDFTGMNGNAVVEPVEPVNLTSLRNELRNYTNQRDNMHADAYDRKYKLLRDEINRDPLLANVTLNYSRTWKRTGLNLSDAPEHLTVVWLQGTRSEYDSVHKNAIANLWQIPMKLCLINPRRCQWNKTNNWLGSMQGRSNRHIREFVDYIPLGTNSNAQIGLSNESEILVRDSKMYADGHVLIYNFERR